MASEYCYFNDCYLSSLLEEEVMECPELPVGGCAACQFYEESFGPCAD